MFPKTTHMTRMLKLAITISDDGSLVRERMSSGLFTSHALDPNISPKMGRGRISERGNILEILVDDAVVVQVLHARQDRTGDKTKPISLSLLSPVEEQSNVPRHCYGISFRVMAALTEALKELATDNGLESEVVFCAGLEPFIELDLQKDNQTC